MAPSPPTPAPEDPIEQPAASPPAVKESAISDPKPTDPAAPNGRSRFQRILRGLGIASAVVVLTLAFWGARELYLTFFYEPPVDEIPIVVEVLDDGSVLLKHRHSVGYGGLLLVEESWPGSVTITPLANGSVRVEAGGSGRAVGGRSDEQPGEGRSGEEEDSADGESEASAEGQSQDGALREAGESAREPGGASASESAASQDGATDLVELRRRELIVPVRGVSASELEDSFDDPRGIRVHRAMDISAPRGTPVLAVDDGVITRLFENTLGGLSIDQRDAESRFLYYYAHLDGFAPTLEEGMEIRQGRVLGYVGSTGNAPDSAPHLHLAIHRIDDPQRPWVRGRAINPYQVYRGR
ncbi:MAG: M23 family metallopeptidase [Acidobacteriota bacterium]